MARKTEKIIVRRKVRGQWRDVTVYVERKSSAGIVDRLVRKHKMKVISRT